MSVGAATWSFTEDDFGGYHITLQRFLYDAKARCALLVDRSGQLVATVGEPPNFDATAFATLTAADFSANDQLARLIGESDFSVLFHQGEKESMYLADIARRVILVVLFDNRTTLGLVRLKHEGRGGRAHAHLRRRLRARATAQAATRRASWPAPKTRSTACSSRGHARCR